MGMPLNSDLVTDERDDGNVFLVVTLIRLGSPEVQRVLDR